MTKKGRNEMANDLKEKWEKQYFNKRDLTAREWYSSEKTFQIGKKSNGSRTMYHMIISQHAKNRRYEIGQRNVNILTTQPREIAEIEEKLEEIGMVKYLKEKYNIEIDQIKTTSTNEHRREVEITLVENNDEGCYGGDDILKEEDRLNLKWR